jgi:hypothetical protein
MYDKAVCPACKKLNLVYLGNWKMATDAAECGNCGHLFLMGDEFEQDGMLRVIIDISYEFTEHTNIDDFLAVRNQMVETLLKGESWDGQTLQEFLKEYASCIQKGELI